MRTALTTILCHFYCIVKPKYKYGWAWAYTGDAGDTQGIRWLDATHSSRVLCFDNAWVITFSFHIASRH